MKKQDQKLGSRALDNNQFLTQPVRIDCAVGEGGAVTVPTRIQLIPMGEWKARDFKIGQEEINQMIGNFNAVSYEPVVDFEHGSRWMGDFETAGWVKALYNMGADGLWAEIEWTEEGVEALAKKKKRYCSPAIAFNARDHRSDNNIGCKLISVALTAVPFLEEMPAIVNSRNNFTSFNTGVSEMDIKKLAQALGLNPDSATEETIMQHLSALKKDERITAVLTALNLGEDATAEQVVTALSKFAKPAAEINDKDAQIANLTAQVQKLQTDQNKRNLVEFLSKGETAKKIIPANKAQWQKLYEGNPELAEISLANAPVLVPLSKFADDVAGDTGMVHNADAQTLNNQLGLTAEDYQKYGKKPE